jgi:hypothetical protein
MISKTYIYILFASLLVLAPSSLANVFITEPQGADTTKQNQMTSVINFADGCDAYSGINLSSANCTYGKYLSFLNYNGTAWNGLCCDFSDTLCANGLFSNYESIYKPMNGYDVYYNTQWGSVCCDSNGKNCYFDNDISTGISSTICDNNIPVFSVEYQTSVWNITYCMGGVLV